MYTSTVRGLILVVKIWRLQTSDSDDYVDPRTVNAHVF